MVIALMVSALQRQRLGAGIMSAMAVKSALLVILTAAFALLLKKRSSHPAATAIVIQTSRAHLALPTAALAIR